MLLIIFLVFSTISYCQEYDYKEDKDSWYNKWMDVVTLSVKMGEYWKTDLNNGISRKEFMRVYVDGGEFSQGLPHSEYALFKCCSFAGVIRDIENKGFQFINMYDSPMYSKEKRGSVFHYNERVMVFRKKK